MKQVTVEDCLELQKLFEKYCETAEQHEFIKLIFIQLLMDRYISRLQHVGKIENQNEANAMFRFVLGAIGKDFSDYEEEEMYKDSLTVDTFKKILDKLSDHGYGDMSILLGSDTPLLKDSISINYMKNELLICNTYFDKKLVDAAEELKDNINESIKHYIAECYHSGMNIKEEEK